MTPGKWQLVAAHLHTTRHALRALPRKDAYAAVTTAALVQRWSTGCSINQLDAPEHTQLRRCSRQCMASINHFSRFQKCRVSAAAASPELPFYLSPVTRLSPMGRRAAWPPSASWPVSITSPGKLYGGILPPAGPLNNIRPLCSCLSGFNHVSLAGRGPHAHK